MFLNDYRVLQTLTVDYLKTNNSIQPDKIPAVPNIVREFMLLLSMQDFKPGQLQSILTKYPEFTQSLLSVINSTHFNTKSQAKDLFQAIKCMGIKSVYQLMLCLVVHKTFDKLNIRGLDLKEFWEDSLRRAVSAQMIGEILGLNSIQCFAFGFLQDLGFLLLLLLNPDKGVLWPEFRKREPEARYSMESNVFNFNHDQALSFLCEKWNLPEAISLTLVQHHAVDDGCNKLNKQFCEVLYAADWFASVYNTVDKSFAIDRCHNILIEKFFIEGFSAEEILAAMPNKISLIAPILNIDIKNNIKFSQILYKANIKLSEDNINFQELTLRLDQALEERDRLATELNRELALAREIQRSLLPYDMGNEYPVVGINISAKDLSGDFYDYFTLADGRIYFNLGDVSGKGVNAALLMAKTSSLFRCLGKRIDDPEELLSQINKELCETSIHGMFVTMVAGIYDPKSNKLNLVNAGNPPALLFSPEGLAREIDAKGPPLGVIAEAEFPGVEINLAKDSLYVFSDGVTEGLTEDGKMMGMSGLFKTIVNLDPNLSPTDRLKKITSKLKKTSQALRDDVTLLILEDINK